MKILVTGGAGFIGSALVKELLNRNHDVKIVDNLSKGTNVPDGVDFLKGDLLDKSIAKKAMKGVDACYHLAALIGGIGYFHKYPADILRDNTIMTTNIFDAAKKENSKVIYLSSSMVFENTEKFPSSEEDVDKIAPPSSAYGFSKLVGERIAKSYKKQYDVNYVIGRPFNAYGAGEVPEEEVGIAHVIPDLIKKVLDGKYPVPILGSGKQIRCYTYVDDLAEGLALLSEKDQALNEDFNIGSDKETSVNDLLEIIWKKLDMDKDLKVDREDPFEHDVQKRVPDVSKAKEKLGWEPKTELEEGIEKTIQWIKKRHYSD